MSKALEWCDVANVLRIQLERQQIRYFPSLREYTLYYGIDKKMLDGLKKEIVLMHPGPINRGVELSSDAADSGHSIILDQVENGVAVRMAVLAICWLAPPALTKKIPPDFALFGAFPSPCRSITNPGRRR